MVSQTVSQVASDVQSQTTQPNLPVFAHADLGTVRVYTNNGEPWFVARDVCECLGFDNAHTNMALSGLDDDEITTSNKVVGRRNLNGLRKDSSLVSESGLYSLIFRSRKPEAKAFRRWVTHEVLPSIRKTGRYSVEPAQLLPYQVIRTLPKSMKDRLSDLVNAKLAHGLTLFGNSGYMEFPNYRRRSRRLCAAPQREKSGLYCFCHQNTSKGVGYILAEQRPSIREDSAAFDKPGSVVLPFFVPNPSIIEVSYV